MVEHPITDQRQRIEELVSSDRRPFTAERMRLWDDLAAKVAEVAADPGEVVENVLGGVSSGLELSRRETAAGDRQAWYWKERDWVEA